MGKKDHRETDKSAGKSLLEPNTRLENNYDDSEKILSPESYRTFIENIDEGVYETDIHGNFTYFNDSLAKVFGYPREEIPGKNFSVFMDKQNTRKAYHAFTKVWVTHRGFTDIIWEISGKDGKKRIIELSAQLIKDSNNKKKGFRGIARDVTDRFQAQKALRESEIRYQCQYEASKRAETRYKTLLDFVPYPIVVFTLTGEVSYLNTAFTQTFGWSMEELGGKRIPYVPENLREEATESIKKLFKEKMIQRYETRRLTKDGRILDVIIRGAVLAESENEHGGELVILRDITHEKRMTRTNEALLRISRALPQYPELDDLLDFISNEIKQLINTDGAIVILLDEEKQELFFQGAAYDDSATQKRAKKMRYPVKNTIAGRVIETGEPIIIDDTSKYPDFQPFVDYRVGLKTHNMIEVPLRSSDRTIGVLCAVNKREGDFDQTDIELLNMIAGTVALSIENARFSDELKEAYREVISLNRAKDKVINHLSHELKTPLSVLLASINILEKRLADLPEETWTPTLERARRNLDRLLDIQYEVEDIMGDRKYKTYGLMSLLLSQCTDELESLVAEETGEVPLIERIRSRIKELFGPEETEISRIRLDGFINERFKTISPEFSHRSIEINLILDPAPDICVPQSVLSKVFDGLLKNAIENTPDSGKIEVHVGKKGTGSELVVRDYGIGITEDNERRIFEGFIATQETLAYSSKRPYDFNAGGKGADLLRMKIFSERYHFRIYMVTSRCIYIPKESDICPGNIDKCGFCKTGEDCHRSGGTTFHLFFPSTPQNGCSLDDRV